MQKKNSTTKQERPRRARMPQKVYETASTLNRRLTNFEVKYPNDALFRGDVTDEVLCQEAAAPLRAISELAFGKELDPEINTHPHNNPWQVEQLVIEAMRLAYGIQDLVDAGRRTNKFERQRCVELFAAFEKLKKATDAADERRYAARHAKPDQEREVTAPQAIPQAAEVINLAAYKTRHGIECATTPNIFGATIYTVKSFRGVPFQVGDIVIGKNKSEGEMPVEVVAIDVDAEGNCSLSFEEGREPIFGAEFFVLYERDGKRFIR